METENKKSIISFIVGILLFGAALYTVYYITTIVDFNTTTVIINNDKNLWKFLAFLPILVIMFGGALAIINGIFNIKALHIFEIILNIAVIIFFKYDLYGFVSIIPNYEKAVGYVIIVLIIGSLLLLIDIILQIIKKSSRRTEVNFEQVD